MDRGQPQARPRCQEFEKPGGKNTDVSSSRTKRMKATDKEILVAVDGEMCEEQTEKFPHHPSPYG